MAGAVSFQVYLEAASRIVLGGFFVVAGVLKLRDLKGFAAIASSYSIVPPDLRQFVEKTSYLLVFAEIAAGSLLILDTYTLFAAAVLGLNLAFFILALVYEMENNPGRPNCGCFGTTLGIELSWSHIGLNILLLILSGYLVATSLV